MPLKENFFDTIIEKRTLDVFFVGHEDKYNRWIEMVNRSVSLQPRKSFKVVSVEKTDRYEDVWCVVEPVTESFVLGKSVKVIENFAHITKAYICRRKVT